MSSEPLKKDRRAEHLARRASHGLTQAELAEEFGDVHPSTISRRLKRIREKGCYED